MTFDERIQKLIEKLGCDETDAQRIRDAFIVASDAHEGQLRKSGEPFIIHPLAVAETLVDASMDVDCVIAALLHDVVEDTDVTYEDLTKRFGKTVADLVEGVTKLTRLPYATKEEEEMENLRKMLLAMVHDIRVIFIKLYDRLHNMRTLEYKTQRKQKDTALQTMLIYAPIAHRLGMNSIKVELEDLSLQYLDPVGCEEIETYLESSKEERSALLSRIIKRIEDRLADEHITAKVKGRIKHTYGIYRKVYMQNKDISQVYDIYGVRVVVETITDCYNVLGIIHDLFKPLPGRFKDYIGTPKPNMYQSLHTTVIGREGKPFEVQIRTHDMHHMAEYGVAAHWKYKHQITETGGEEKIAWVRQLLEAGQDSDAEEFIKSLRLELFTDEVFVFTPKGDVINLPSGATPIDFAYAIHSAVGNKMVGAKVNERIVQLDAELHSGDIVEVLTTNTPHGPSRDWLNIVKTGEARNKIKQWFKKERRDENIERGKSELDAELKRNLLSRAFAQDEIQQLILKKHNFSSMDDMYAAIGYGGITARKIVNRVSEECQKAEKQQNKVLKPIREAKPTSGVIVEGIDNCLVKFARCCTPIPGDTIVGFITKGYGVSVHRADCPNILSMLKNPDNSERTIGVTWAKTVTDHFQTALQLSCKNRVGLLADIVLIMSDMRIDVTNLSARELDDGGALVQAVIQLKSAEQLGQVMIKLRKVSGVLNVSRNIQ